MAIAEAALVQGGLDRVDFLVSTSPLGKEAGITPLEVRLQLLEAVAGSRPWMSVTVNESGLICDVVAGYDAVVLGADKWRQVNDPAWYSHSSSRRDGAVARLPRLLVAGRDGEAIDGLPLDAVVLSVPPNHGLISSTAVRNGRLEWVAPEAAAIWNRHRPTWPDDRPGGSG